jgi:hypothetical protein
VKQLSAAALASAFAFAVLGVAPLPAQVQGGRDLATEAAAARAEAEKKTPIPRMKDGKPDFTGMWRPSGIGATFAWEAHPAGFGTASEGPTIIGDPADGILPYQPWALKERERRRRPETAYEENSAKCTITGMPRLLVYTFSFQQYPDKLVVFHATTNIATRTVRFDNRPPLPATIRLWMGDARGRWEGDTLVIETTNLNGQAWLNLGGDVMSDAMHITERYRMLNATTMSFEAVIDDPKVYTRPWTMKFPGPHVRVGTSVVNDQEYDFEDSCLEGNVDLVHFKNMYDAARAKSGSR